MNLFIAEPVALSTTDIALAQALADMASIAILQERATQDAALREEQLQRALDSRIRIEQAKGIISQGAGVDMDVSFGRLRTFARDHNRRLGDVAQDLVDGRLAWSDITRVRR
jgi:AmiR/NasT family two-component response regulator